MVTLFLLRLLLVKLLNMHFKPFVFFVVIHNQYLSLLAGINSRELRIGFCVDFIGSNLTVGAGN